MRLAILGAALALLLGHAAEARADFLFWANNGNQNIDRSNLDGSGLTTILTGLQSPQGVAVAGGQVYWGENNAIKTSDFDGAGVTTLVSAPGTYPGLAVDLPDGKLFYTNGSTRTIWSVPLAGGAPTLLFTDTPEPTSLVLDLSHGKMYWIDLAAGNNDEIRSANLDGTNVQTVITGLSFPQYIALDAVQGLLYGTEFSTSSIFRVNTDGTGKTTLVSGLNGPMGIAIDLTGGRMYWTDLSAGDVRSANLEGTGMTVVASGLSTPTGISINASAAAPAAPEPGSLALLLCGGMLLGLRRPRLCRDAC